MQSCRKIGSAKFSKSRSATLSGVGVGDGGDEK
jgi:hypothetical protein